MRTDYCSLEFPLNVTIYFEHVSDFIENVVEISRLDRGTMSILFFKTKDGDIHEVYEDHICYIIKQKA